MGSEGDFLPCSAPRPIISNTADSTSPMSSQFLLSPWPIQSPFSKHNLLRNHHLSYLYSVPKQAQLKETCFLAWHQSSAIQLTTCNQRPVMQQARPIRSPFSQHHLLRNHHLSYLQPFPKQILVFSSTGQRPASYCHGVVSVVRPFACL